MQAAPEPAAEPELDAADLQLSSDEEPGSPYDSEDELELSGSDAGGSGSDGDDVPASARGVDHEIEDAVLGYMAAADKRRQQQGADRWVGTLC